MSEPGVRSHHAERHLDGVPRRDGRGSSASAIGGGIQVDAEVIEDEQHCVEGGATVAVFEAGERLTGDADGVGDVLLGEVPLEAGVLGQAGEV